MALVAATVVSPATARAKPISFKLEIKPVLQKICYRCHNANNAKGGLDLTTKAAILKGGSEGQLFKAGKGGTQMPMGEPALKSSQIKLVTRWINEGGKIEN